MLGLTKQIDCVVKEPGELVWRVVLEVHAGEWLRHRAVWLLEEKLNAYAGFVLDGHMRSLYPASSPANTHIVVASVDPLPGQAIALLQQAAAALVDHAVTLTWKDEGGMAPDGTPPPRGLEGGGPLDTRDT
jgi:hypothetical protein